MILSWSDEEEADGDLESDTAKRVTAMTRRVESESESGDEDPYYEKVVVPYSYQDINDADTSKLLIEQEEIISRKKGLVILQKSLNSTKRYVT